MRDCHVHTVSAPVPTAHWGVFVNDCCSTFTCRTLVTLSPSPGTTTFLILLLYFKRHLYLQLKQLSSHQNVKKSFCLDALFTSSQVPDERRHFINVSNELLTIPALSSWPYFEALDWFVCFCNIKDRLTLTLVWPCLYLLEVQTHTCFHFHFGSFNYFLLLFLKHWSLALLLDWDLTGTGQQKVLRVAKRGWF